MSELLKPSVFIIESLSFQDEAAERLEGRILQDILKLSKKESAYFYIRTRKELAKVLARFTGSRMRYLHISCHGSQDSIALTLDTVGFEEFGRLVKPHLSERRRLFCSACQVVNEKLAGAVIPGSDCWSIVGPSKEITFGDAALMWASFYHLVFRENPKGMNRKQIVGVLERICRAFSVPFTYFRRADVPPYFEKQLLTWKRRVSS
jgi:hypothetical protein